jgi:hypothetical protein
MASLGLDMAHIDISLNHAILLPNTHFRNIRACKPIERTYLAADIAGMVTPPRKPLLSTQARRTLELLDGFEHGVAEEFLTLSGFKREMLANLVLAGLITVVTETIQAGTSTTMAERYHITDAGRRALEE